MIAVALTIGVTAAACEGEDVADTERSDTPTGAVSLYGGTLRMALIDDLGDAFDPQKEYHHVSWEYYRCCLLRTLMSYEGVPMAEGGHEIHPDLAVDEPTVSGDGLTTTFQIKPGLMYAPPKDDTEIKAQDFIRALERAANPKVIAPYSFYYSVIEGFDDFAAGGADTITGLSARHATRWRSGPPRRSST